MNNFRIEKKREPQNNNLKQLIKKLIIEIN